MVSQKQADLLFFLTILKPSMVNCQSTIDYTYSIMVNYCRYSIQNAKGNSQTQPFRMANTSVQIVNKAVYAKSIDS